MLKNTKNIAYFISPHGFGHATRAAAVIQALMAVAPNVSVTVFSKVPKFLFAECGCGTLNMEATDCDVGLKQHSATQVDLEASVATLRAFWPAKDSTIKSLANRLKNEAIDLVVSDISPIGILAASEAGLPSVLVENFTWDWIYQGMKELRAPLEETSAYLRTVFAKVDVHIQSEPFCQLSSRGYQVDPIVRPILRPREQWRESFGFQPHHRLILLTMGGLMDQIESFEALGLPKDVFLVLPGSGKSGNQIQFLGEAADFYHPDAVAGVDLVVGKLGYSTVCEALQAGTPYAFLDRPDFPESAELKKYLSQHLPCFELASLDLKDWKPFLGEWLSVPRMPAKKLLGATQTAAQIKALLLANG